MYAVELSEDNEQPAVALTWLGFDVCYESSPHILFKE